MPNTTAYIITDKYGCPIVTNEPTMQIYWLKPLADRMAMKYKDASVQKIHIQTERPKVKRTQDA